jgi:hypothetical protein
LSCWCHIFSFIFASLLIVVLENWPNCMVTFPVVCCVFDVILFLNNLYIQCIVFYIQLETFCLWRWFHLLTEVFDTCLHHHILILWGYYDLINRFIRATFVSVPTLTFMSWYSFCVQWFAARSVCSLVELLTLTV